MSDKKDIRWQQRFNNFNKAFSQFRKFIDKGNLNEFEEQGLIHSFEYTYELGWNVIKDYLEFSGNKKLMAGSRDATSEAFRLGIIKDGEGWMQMFKDRNQTSHTYNEDTAKEITGNILKKHFSLLSELKLTFERIINGQTDLFNDEQ